MSENNLPNIDGEENTAPAAEENTAPSIEEEAAAAEENITAEETADDITAAEDEIFAYSEEQPMFDTEAASEPQGDIPQVPDLSPEPKKSSAGKVAAIVILVIAILAVIGVCVYKQLTRNPYNELGYINVSGRTIGEVAEAAGYATVDEFLAEYSLPADMPADTEESAAYYSIPTRKIAEMYGMEVDELKELLGLGDDVTEETPWGEAEGKAPLGKYIGEAYLDQFKEKYGLGDEVTADTLWGEVRNTVDQKTLEQQQAAQKDQSQETDSAAVGDDDANIVLDDAGNTQAETDTAQDENIEE